MKCEKETERRAARKMEGTLFLTQLRDEWKNANELSILHH